MGIRDDLVSTGFLRLLRKHIPQLRLEPSDIQMAIAYLVRVSPNKSRRHKGREGYMSITYQELEKHFGRGKFVALNDRLAIFDVTPNWWSEEGFTRGFKLKPDLAEVVSKYLLNWRRRMYKTGKVLIGLDGKAIHQIPQAVASKDMKGITAKAWDRAAVRKLVPVDHKRLHHYARTLEQKLDDPQADLFFVGNSRRAIYILEVIGALMELAREDGGQWFVVQRYIESDSGRLYGKNINLQTVPSEVKQVALHGLYEYDFANCHYTILHHLAEKYGLPCHAIGHYLANKKAVRQQVMADIGIDADQAKTCLIALIYGARFSHREEDAIPAEIGKEAALRLYKHPLFAALKQDVTVARGWIINGWSKSRRRLQNAYGKWISKDEGHPQILAHLLQGVEAKMLESVRKLYSDQIVLLQHDGFASTAPLDIDRMVEAIWCATGLQMKIEESRISLSPNLGID